METLMILTYAALCYGVFKAFKIRITGYSVGTAVLGGMIMLGLVLLLMNYNHPYTKVAQTFAVTTPIIPSVKGRVIEIPVKGNTKLSKGDILFRIDPVPFQLAVDRLEAILSDAETKSNQIEARLLAAQAATSQTREELQASRSELGKQARQAVEQAGAVVDEIKAELDLAQSNEVRERELLRKGIIAKKRYDEARQRLVGVRAKLRQAEAAERQSIEKLGSGGARVRSVQEQLRRAEAQEREAKLAYDAESGGVNPQVRQRTAELNQAKRDLRNTVVRAPTDGFVTQLALRPGMMAVPLPLAPTMVFVHDERPKLVASFLQNSLQRLETGAVAEVIFPALPGKLFTGRVESVFPVIEQGAVQASGRLISQRPGPPGRAPVVIKLDNDMEDVNLPAGARAEVAIITDHVHHVAIIRQILLRMKSWQNFIFSEGH